MIPGGQIADEVVTLLTNAGLNATAEEYPYIDRKTIKVDTIYVAYSGLSATLSGRGSNGGDQWQDIHQVSCLFCHPQATDESRHEAVRVNEQQVVIGVDALRKSPLVSNTDLLQVTRTQMFDEQILHEQRLVESPIEFGYLDIPEY